MPTVQTEYTHDGDYHEENEWSKQRIIARKGKTISKGVDTDFSAVSGTAASLCSDGTFIWTVENTTNAIKKYNNSDTLVDSSTTLPTLASGDFVACEYYNDGSNEWIFALVVDEGTPSTTHVVKYNANDLSESEYVNDISAEFDSPRAGGSIAKHPNSNYWLVGEAKGPTSDNFTQNVLLFTGEDFKGARKDVLVYRYEGAGFSDATFKDNLLYLSTPVNEWFVFNFDRVDESLTLVNAHDVSSVSSAGVAWDGSTFLGFSTNNVIDIDLTDNTNLVMLAVVVDTDKAHGLAYAEVARPTPAPQQYMGFSTFRAAGVDIRIFDFRVFPYTENPPTHGDWSGDTHPTRNSGGKKRRRILNFWKRGKK